MALLDNLQSILGGQNQGANQAQSSPITSLLAPAALGGLMGALMTNKKARKITGNVLLVGGGAALATVLWNKYKNRGAAAQQANPLPQPAQPAPFSSYQSQPAFTQGFAQNFDLNAKAKRLIRATIFAAKSDGVIDAQEQQATQETIGQLQLGQDAEQIIN